MKVNQSELSIVYEQLELTEEDLHFLHNLQSKKWRGIVLTADWCGDAALNVPVIQRMAEEVRLNFVF